MKRCLLITVMLLASAAAFAQDRNYPSPDGKYHISYNADRKAYYMHDNRMGYTYCVTCDVAADTFSNDIEPAWRSDSRYVYLSGIYDIWQIDITRAVAPVKISKRKKNAPVKYYLIMHDSIVTASPYIYMRTENTATGEIGNASFYQKGYRYQYKSW